MVWAQQHNGANLLIWFQSAQCVGEPRAYLLKGAILVRLRHFSPAQDFLNQSALSASSGRSIPQPQRLSGLRDDPPGCFAVFFSASIIALMGADGLAAINSAATPA